jgi:hypothetical protein
MKKNMGNNKALNVKNNKVKPKNRTNCLIVGNSMRIYGDGRQPKQRTNMAPFKYADTFGSNVNIMATGTVLPGLIQVAVGPGVSQRVGNRIYIEKMFFNYNIVQVNTDVTSQCRVIVFQWRPSSTLVMPLVPDVLETVNDVQSMYNWELSDQYKIIHDQVYFLSGIAASLTTSSHVGYYGEIDLSSAVKTLEFTGASALGSQQLYFLIISDSLVAPFPVMDYTTRVVYKD